jgi:Ca-activated chloride channel family protein
MSRQRCRHEWIDGVMWGAILLGVLGIGEAARAQGLLVNVSPTEQARLPRPTIVVTPRHPQPTVPQASYKIQSLDVNAKLIGPVAQVQIAQTFVNTGSRTMEVAFVFPLPPDVAIDRLTLLVDGKELAGKLLNKDEARRRYEEIVRKNQDPALLEWLGGGMFQTSVFPVPPGQERKVVLSYTQVCRRDQGVTDFLFPLSTAKYTTHPVERVRVRVTIDGDEKLKNVYSPTHAVEIKRQAKSAVVTFEAKNEIPTSDFRLMYDVGEGKLSARVLSYRPKDRDDGYFLLLAAPQIVGEDDEPTAKTVVFVVDRSGSMSGEKIEQAKGAAKFLVNNLRPGDLFNIVAYDDRIESFRPELQRFNDQTRAAALGFIESLYAGGSTNIDGALGTALDQLKDSSRPNYVLFLTDGLPTAGEVNEARIVERAAANNRVRARVIAFGVGYDVNSRLLDKLARANYGQSAYVRPNEDLEAHVARLYRKMEAPVLTDVKLSFVRDEMKQEDGPPVNRLYPRETFDLFAGEQLIVVGRYKKSGSAHVRIEGQVGGERKEFAFPAKLTDSSRDDTFAFIEKLWATRRVGEILDQLDLKGRNEELVKELVELSTRHGILTPYTSFLADETVDFRATTANAATTKRNLEMLEKQAEGLAGVAQRATKNAYQYAPSAAAAAPAGAGGGAIYNGYRDAQTDRDVVVTTNRNIGNKSFFRRGNQWIDSTVTEAQTKNARRVVQFSDEYFELAEKHGRRLSQYLVSDEPVLVNIDDETLLIEPAGPNGR